MLESLLSPFFLEYPRGECYQKLVSSYSAQSRASNNKATKKHFLYLLVALENNNIVSYMSSFHSNWDEWICTLFFTDAFLIGITLLGGSMSYLSGAQFAVLLQDLFP